MARDQWTVKDKAFLKSMGIAAGEASAPLPRFRVVPGGRPGWFEVIDSARVFKAQRFGPTSIPTAASAAADKAAELNQKHASKP